MVGAATIQTIKPSCSSRLSRSGFGANRFSWKARYPIEAVLLHCKIRSKSGLTLGFVRGSKGAGFDFAFFLLL